MRIIATALVMAAATAFTFSDASGHHGKKEEHAQPATVRGGCTWLRAGKTYKSLAACTKGSSNKGSCNRACK